jgi:hypothetical protein
MRIVCWPVLSVGVLLFSLNGAAAQGTPDARQACTPDAMRLCSEFIPDAGKVKTCMMAKRSQLSQECRTAIAAGRGGGRHVARHHKAHRHSHHHHHHNDD